MKKLASSGLNVQLAKVFLYGLQLRRRKQAGKRSSLSSCRFFLRLGSVMFDSSTSLLFLRREYGFVCLA